MQCDWSAVLGKVTVVPAVHRGASEYLLIEAGETIVDLGREQENYLLGLGFGKITYLALRLLLQYFISLREEV